MSGSVLCSANPRSWRSVKNGLHHFTSRLVGRRVDRFTSSLAVFDTMSVSALTIALNTSFWVAVPPEAPCVDRYFGRHMALPAAFAHFDMLRFEFRASAQATKKSCVAPLHLERYALLPNCVDGMNENRPVD